MRNRFLLSLVAALAVPILALANAKREQRPPTDVLVLVYGAGEQFVNGRNVVGGIVGARPITITRASMWVTTQSGGGAGYTTVVISDGTNSCNVAWLCTDTGSAGIKAASLSAGTGSGCTFPAGAVLTGTVQTASCTTTQPTARSVLIFAKEI